MTDSLRLENQTKTITLQYMQSLAHYIKNSVTTQLKSSLITSNTNCLHRYSQQDYCTKQNSLQTGNNRFAINLEQSNSFINKLSLPGQKRHEREVPVWALNNRRSQYQFNKIPDRPKTESSQNKTIVKNILLSMITIHSAASPLSQSLRDSGQG